MLFLHASSLTLITVTDKLSFTYPYKYNFCYSIFALHRIHIYLFFSTAPHLNIGITVPKMLKFIFCMLSDLVFGGSTIRSIITTKQKET